MADDRFDVRYQPAAVTPAAMLATVRELGYEPELVERAPDERAPAPARVDVAALPPELRATFAEAARAERPLLLAFSAPG